MKQIFVIVLSLSLASAAWAQEAQPVAQVQQVSAPEMRKCKLGVKGMYCSGCVTSVENALKNLDGVGEVAVDLKSGEAKFTYDPAKVNPVAGIKAVERVGFKAEVKSESGVN